MKLLNIYFRGFKFIISYTVTALDNKPIILQPNNLFNNPVTDMANLIRFMIYVFPICECKTNRFDRGLNTEYYCLLCCDWFWCQCIGVLNAYIHVTGAQLVDSLTRKTSRDVCMVYKPRLYTIYQGKKHLYTAYLFL